MEDTKIDAIQAEIDAEFAFYRLRWPETNGQPCCHGATMTDYTGLLRVHSLSAALVTTNLAQRPGRRFMDGK
jgi:hypothetical protein